MKASDLFVRCLEHEGVEYVFAVPGEENLDLLDSLSTSAIRIITARHEQGAAFMADVYGRLTGRAGVCLSTLGPGATNLLTGVADATLDHAPLVAITGQVSLDRMHKESHQYIDVMAMFRPVTKWQAQLISPAIIAETVRKAFKVSQADKPGATHLEIPEDVAAMQTAPGDLEEPLRVQAAVMPEPPPSQIERAKDLIRAARRPVILAGNGVVRRHAHEAVRRFARHVGIPVLHTFMGKGIMPDTDSLSLYTIGLRIRDSPAMVMQEADVVIAVGYDLVEYAPCYWNPERDKRIVHIDVAPAEVDAHYIVDVGLVGDVALSLELLGNEMGAIEGGWAGEQRRRIVAVLDGQSAGAPTWPMRPSDIISTLRAALGPDDVVICDVGLHKLWMARLFPCLSPNTCVISNGFASMGIALPGAVAAKLVYPARHVVAVTGDGGFLMNVQELETAVRAQTPMTVLIWRDNGYGVIRWNQMKRFGRTTGVEFGNPDFVRLAESYGALGFRVDSPADLRPALDRALASNNVAVIDCPVDYAGTHLAEDN